MNFSPTTTEALAMLRLLPRAHAQSRRATKRPVGGRPNPCALHQEPRHGAALARAARVKGVPPTRRRARLADASGPAWQQFSDAVVAGAIPVGVVLTEVAIKKAIGCGVSFGMATLALQLSAQSCPVRLREVANHKFIAVIL